MKKEVKRKRKKLDKEKNLARLERIRENRRIIEDTFLAFYKSRIFSNRLNYESFFSEQLIKYWELYVNEIQIALSQISEHEKDFLENCFIKRMSYKDMYLSKSAFYRCLRNYSAKFLSFFDHELFHKKLKEIYNSETDPSFSSFKKPK
ncbi:hypothetical protein [Mycoplasma suis]|uniref:Uncharacterized protein n=2 Tax=Mycoplasma suis TaxID=57372 RepID=F0QSA1_MYCSL|nr:hypothetical protein [Mycoplasma suis]ADX98371.1 hypothetical protein MSU_0859 [Mycoplasma suis str. Illinois]CBZ40879.1 hypothetical protein MSUIS_07860 [Mycoplasma suis KI3806]